MSENTTTFDRMMLGTVILGVSGFGVRGLAAIQLPAQAYANFALVSLFLVSYGLFLVMTDEWTIHKLNQIVGRPTAGDNQ